MPRPLTDYDVLTFDCYGTLIDWETGIWDALQPLVSKAGSTKIDRNRVLELFATAESRLEAERPGALYPEILEGVHRALAAELDLPTDSGLAAEFGRSVAHWPAFSDSADALRALKTRYRLVILSNIHEAGIAASIRKLGVEFDAVYTAEKIGSYKPSKRNFEYLLEHLDSDFGIAPDRVLHTAQSLFHDHVPAKRLGLASAWIDRQGLSEGGPSGATAPVEDRPEIDFVFPTLEAMSTAAHAPGAV